MTTDNARALAAEFHTRADQIGDRAAEGLHLRRAALTIINLCAQIDAAVNNTKPTHGSPPADPEPESL